MNRRMYCIIGKKKGGGILVWKAGSLLSSGPNDQIQNTCRNNGSVYIPSKPSFPSLFTVLKGKKLSLPMPVWSHFQTTPEIPKMKLYWPQLSFPGPCWLKNGSAGLHSSARKTARPGQLVCLSPGWDPPSILLRFFSLEIGANKYCWPMLRNTARFLPALPSTHLHNMPLPYPQEAKGNCHSPPVPNKSWGGHVILSLITYTKVTGPVCNHRTAKLEWPHKDWVPLLAPRRTIQNSTVTPPVREHRPPKIDSAWTPFY